MNKLILRFGAKAGWPLVIFCIIVLVVFAIIRSLHTYGFSETPQQLFELRYLDHPIIAAIHMASGIAFILFAPLQFLKKLRSKHLNLHRRLGRVLLVCALFSGVYGLAATVALPGFGGVSSETAAWFFGPLFLFSLLRAYWCVRNKKIALHREWMIRAFALGLGVGSQRIILSILIPTTGYGFEQSFGSALWLGFAVNLLIAEIWINATRGKRDT